MTDLTAGLCMYDVGYTICAIIQQLFGQNQRRQNPLPSTSDCSCLRPRLQMSFLYQRAGPCMGPFCPVRRINYGGLMKLGLMGVGDSISVDA